MQSPDGQENPQYPRFIPSENWQLKPAWAECAGALTKGDHPNIKVRWEPPIPSPETVLNTVTGEFQKADSPPPKASAKGKVKSEDELREEARAARERVGKNGSTFAEGHSIRWFAQQPINNDNTLLGDRYLCRTSGMFVVAPSGLGKSTLSIQLAILWCCGLVAFGIRPRKALRILIVQSEDDEGDCIEMSRMMEHLGLTETQKALVESNSLLIRCNNLRSFKFVEALRAELAYACEAGKPWDLIIINPYGVYLGNDTKNDDATIYFLNELINPLLMEFNCGLVAIHHTPKTNFQNTDKFKAWDWQYWGAGCAAMTNWARAMLVIKPETDDLKVYRFIAAKRGPRIGWEGEFERYFAHSSVPGVLKWEEASATQIGRAKSAGSKQKQVDLNKALDQVPLADAELKKSVIQKIHIACQVGINPARNALEQLIFEGKVNQVDIPNPIPKRRHLEGVIRA